MNRRTGSRPPTFIDTVRQLAAYHARIDALTRIQFFDYFGLDINDQRGGYTAGDLYSLYLNVRRHTRANAD